MSVRLGRLRPRVRLGKSLDWRYFSKRCPAFRDVIYQNRKNQQALKELHAKLVKNGYIRA